MIGWTAAEYQEDAASTLGASDKEMKRLSNLLILILVAGMLAGFGGEGLHGSGSIGPAGPTGPTGPTGPSGVVTATAPVTYNSGSKTVGITLTTTPAADNSATDVFSTQGTQNAINLSMATIPLSNITGGTYSFAAIPTVPAVISFAVASPPGPITSISSIITHGTGYAIGDVITVSNLGNADAMLQVATLSGASGVGSLNILYGGTGYTSSISGTVAPANTVPYTFTLTGALSNDATFIMPNGSYLLLSNQWIVNNNTTGAHKVIFQISNGSDTATGNGVVIPPGTSNSCGTYIETDGSTDIWLVSAPPACAGAGYPYDVWINSFTPAAGATVFEGACPRTLTFAANLANAVAVCGTNPSESDAYTLNVAGSPAATITLSSACAISLSSQAAFTCTAGQALTLVAPTPVSGALIGITIPATR